MNPIKKQLWGSQLSILCPVPSVEKHFLTDKYIYHQLNKVCLKRFLLSSLNYRNHRTMYVSRVKPKFDACVGILGLSLFFIRM